MKKDFFESEEQAEIFIGHTTPVHGECFNLSTDVYKELKIRILDCYKHQGYIKKSDLEIAREKFVKSDSESTIKIESDYYVYSRSYIDFLQKEIERLKKLLWQKMRF